MINQKTIELEMKCSSLDWIGDRLIDWTSDRVYFDPNNEGKYLNKYNFGDRFDGIKSINKGEYVVIYEKLGTKGLILKNGKLLREINRSYYSSSAYEYPVEIFKGPMNTILLAHCPDNCNRIEIEEIETGECLTKSSKRKPLDIFHSRFEVSPNGKFLISAGWVWHPFDVLTVFDIQKAISEPATLDSHLLGPNVSSEVSCARFMKDSRILISTTKEEPTFDEDENTLLPNYVGIYNIELDCIETMWEQSAPIGNIFPINKDVAWDLFGYPKIVDLQSGQVIESIDKINSGKQNSSIIHHHDVLPKTAVSQDGTKLAVSNDNKVEILEWEKDA